MSAETKANLCGEPYDLNLGVGFDRSLPEFQDTLRGRGIEIVFAANLTYLSRDALDDYRRLPALQSDGYHAGDGLSLLAKGAFHGCLLDRKSGDHREAAGR